MQVKSKYKVPEGMLKDAVVAYNAKTCAMGYRYAVDRWVVEVTLEAAIRWQAENPPIPTIAQWKECLKAFTCGVVTENMGTLGCQEWVRRMYLEPEPEVPEEIRPLLRMDIMGDWVKIHAAIIEAYRRGREGK